MAFFSCSPITCFYSTVHLFFSFSVAILLWTKPHLNKIANKWSFCICGVFFPLKTGILWDRISSSRLYQMDLKDLTVYSNFIFMHFHCIHTIKQCNVHRVFFQIECRCLEALTLQMVWQHLASSSRGTLINCISIRFLLCYTFVM